MLHLHVVGSWPCFQSVLKSIVCPLKIPPHPVIPFHYPSSHSFNMFKSLSILALVAATIGRTLAVGVSGKAEGFASGVTGGGSASPVYPKDIKELVSYLGDSSARVIVLQKTYDFTGSEGTGSGKVVCHGAPVLDVKSPSTRTAGARTMRHLPQRLPSPMTRPVCSASLSLLTRL